MIDQERTMTETPVRRTVATYRTYEEAQRAVDFLADRKFPVERTAIVGEGLSLVEQVTGRMDIGRAALGGLVSGAVTGLFFGYLVGLFNLAAPFVSAFTLALYGLVAGAVIGAILGAIFHAMSGGHRDFRSISGVQADHYLLNVDDGIAPEATRLLEERR